MAVVYTPQCFTPTIQLTTGNNTLDTGPVNGGHVIRKANFANVTGSPVTLVLHRVPNGGSVSGTNIFLPSTSIAAGTSLIVNELNGMVLNNGDTLVAVAGTGAALNATMNGLAFA